MIRPVNLLMFKMMMEASIEQFFQRDILMRAGMTYTQGLDEIVGILLDGVAVIRKVIDNKKEKYKCRTNPKVIFNNEIDRKAYRKAINSKKKYARKYGDDSNADYRVTIKKNKYIGDMLSVYDVRVADKPATYLTVIKKNLKLIKSIIVGNIRMGFGHYRISMAIASAANAPGCVPYWTDLNSCDNTTCTKVIRAQNDCIHLVQGYHKRAGCLTDWCGNQ